MSSNATAQRQIGPYVVLEKIGSGSFAAVFKAAHTSAAPQQPDALVAIKAIEKRKLTAKLQEAINSEIDIMERIRHKNIVRLFGKQHSPHHIYLVLELCAGGDLHHYIRRQGTLSAEVSRHFMRELAQGLEFLWRHALVHRDLKPHNLLLSSYSPTAQLKIADFGFARHLGEANMANTLCGSPLYMAPEILAHNKYDAKADLWSVGTILYEMLAGKPPFTGSDPKELLDNIQRVELRIPHTADTTPEAVDLLRKLLRRKPTERISFKEFFDSSYLGLKSNGKSISNDRPKDFADLEFKPKLLESVAEGSGATEDDSENDVGNDEEDVKPPMAVNFDNEMDAVGKRWSLPAVSAPTKQQDIGIDDAWELVDEAVERRANLQQQAPVPSAPSTNQLNPIASTKPPLHPQSATSRRAPLVSVQQQMRKQASGRAATFAIQVCERAVHLAKLAERIVDAYEEFSEEAHEDGDEFVRCECARAASASLVMEAFRLLTLSLSAAEDAAEAERKKNRAGGTTALVQDIKAWLLACKEKSDMLLEDAASAGTIPNPRLMMFKVALGLGRRAAGRELLEANALTDLTAIIEEDYSLGLMLLQLLTVHTDMSSADRRQVHGYIALFQKRLQSLGALR